MVLPYNRSLLTKTPRTHKSFSNRVHQQKLLVQTRSTVDKLMGSGCDPLTNVYNRRIHVFFHRRGFMASCTRRTTWKTLVFWEKIFVWFTCPPGDVLIQQVSGSCRSILWWSISLVVFCHNAQAPFLTDETLTHDMFNALRPSEKHASHVINLAECHAWAAPTVRQIQSHAAATTVS